MNLIILRTNLLDGLSSIERAVGENTNLPILKNILIRTPGNKIELVSTNLELAVEASVSGKIIEKGEITVPFSIFNSTIKNLNTERIILEEKGKKLIVKTDNYEAIMQIHDPKEFPIIPSISNEKNNIKIIQLIRNDLVTQAIWYTGNYNTSRLARRIDFNAKYPDAKVRVQKTANTIESIVKFHKHLEPIASITLFYEGDLSVDGDGTKTFYNTQAKSNLCNSLGISSFEFNIEGRVKSNKDFLDSDDIFVNIQELYDELKKRGLKRFYKDI